MKRVLSVILILMIVSCAKNPFSTRDSETPTQRAGTFIPPTIPEIVLENIRLSYSELVIGNFIQSIDSSFVFKFDFIQGVQGDSSWGFAQEIRITENMFTSFNAAKSNRSIRIDLSSLSDQPDVILDTSATLIRGYVLTVVDSAGVTVESYEGVAQFRLVENAFNFWGLAAWEDLHKNLQSRSWAEFKNAYR